MKLRKPLFLVLILCCGALSLTAQQFPKPQQPPTLVRGNDYLDLLTPSQEEALENKLVAYDKKTSNQIAIITTDDLLGMDVGDYATELGRRWGVGGQKEFNNGVVMVVYRSKDGSKRKVFIAVGYGLEGVVPDYTASEIVNNEIIPYLKGGDFYHALDNGTTKIMDAIGGKYTAPEGYQKGKGPSMFTVLLIIFLVILVLSIISKGGGGGSYMSRRGYRRDYTGPTIWWTGGGGGWSGGGGGSSGGGGFGGFGGGSFGGGGAGGDW